ncbi:aldehyde dehydrogenase family protein [Amaricoccus sp.]|uniref:aldehyde dehydrogenase family protein n=1 Tax=Amaricoccus sp. TaxID=1872485 RepID=UPI001B641D6A|nr:aldehyde dehydrogenase family protein [Amaricoccus sp.]MBP7003064.1 aldehyde dehydrogenase family protein [Amaricoccus sp.]
MPDATLPNMITGVLVSGTWRDAASGESLDVWAPAEGRPFARIAAGGPADIDLAVAAARAALAGEWGSLPAVERGRLLSAMAPTVLAHAGELAALEARDTGKPIAQARADILACARYFEYYGGAADKLGGRQIPFQNGYLALTERVPLGVTAHIIPWNYPAQMFPRSIGPALAMGNAVVMKPAEDACLTPLRLADLMTRSGFPPGAVNIVTGEGATAGAALAGHPGVDFISFIGSAGAGAAVQAAAARNHVGCTLELGGKSAQIVFADADPDRVVPAVVAAITQHAGQTCSAGSRLVIERAAMERVLPRIAEAFSRVRAVPPQMEGELGPLVSPRQRARVEDYLALAEADGLPILARGRIVAEASPEGWFVEPRMIGPVPRDHRLAREEVFGPVLAVLPFEDEADAVALANATPYGLVAGVWTRDGARALRVARRMQTGQVFVNCYGAGGGVELPFGGMKRSGHGREKGWEALLAFSTLRTLVIRHD